LRLPDNLASGAKCLEYEVPWMTEGAIRKLDDVLEKDQTVVEFGAGGSSLFFARRCHSVISFETDRRWAQRVVEHARDRSVHNLHVFVEDDPDLLAECARRLGHFDVVSVDAGRPHDRDRLLEIVARRSSPRLAVCDNYAAPMFPVTGALDAKGFASHMEKLTGEEWGCVHYDDPRWWGKGTRIGWPG
jgi:predicted O-methyltransferase YrrM